MFQTYHKVKVCVPKKYRIKEMYNIRTKNSSFRLCMGIRQVDGHALFVVGIRFSGMSKSKEQCQMNIVPYFPIYL